ncbi:DNA cytosine methyltransferase [Veillonella rogosae]|uniref:DNA cytosine methyltransferase n=1 Tax=Veillonella rogosae TaxID=423477 RepID=UPI0025B2D3CE|nr:DNA cytosine methyltransferase [Veillonella rogosae]
MGYTVHMDILNSAWYGAATKRERLIIVAIRNDVEDIFEYPQPPQYMDQSIYRSGLDKNLLKLPSPKTVNDALRLIDYKDVDDIDNLPMNHSEKTVRRFKYIPEGDNIANHMDLLPDELKISKFYSRGSDNEVGW